MQRRISIVSLQPAKMKWTRCSSTRRSELQLRKMVLCPFKTWYRTYLLCRSKRKYVLTFIDCCSVLYYTNWQISSPAVILQYWIIEIKIIWTKTMTPLTLYITNLGHSSILLHLLTSLGKWKDFENRRQARYGRSDNLERYIILFCRVVGFLQFLFWDNFT